MRSQFLWLALCVHLSLAAPSTAPSSLEDVIRAQGLAGYQYCADLVGGQVLTSTVTERPQTIVPSILSTTTTETPSASTFTVTPTTTETNVIHSTSISKSTTVQTVPVVVRSDVTGQAEVESTFTPSTLVTSSPTVTNVRTRTITKPVTSATSTVTRTVRTTVTGRPPVSVERMLRGRAASVSHPDYVDDFIKAACNRVLESPGATSIITQTATVTSGVISAVSTFTASTPTETLTLPTVVVPTDLTTVDATSIETIIEQEPSTSISLNTVSIKTNTKVQTAATSTLTSVAPVKTVSSRFTTTFVESRTARATQTQTTTKYVELQCPSGFRPDYNQEECLCNRDSACNGRVRNAVNTCDQTSHCAFTCNRGYTKSIDGNSCFKVVVEAELKAAA